MLVHTAACVRTSLFTLVVKFPQGLRGWQSLVRMSSLSHGAHRDRQTHRRHVHSLPHWFKCLEYDDEVAQFATAFPSSNYPFGEFICRIGVVWYRHRRQKAGGPGHQPGPVPSPFCDIIPSYWPLTQFCQRGSWRVAWTYWHSSAKTAEPTQTLTTADGIQTCGITN